MTGFGVRGGAPRPGVRWSLVVPVKHLGRAKTRLALAAGGLREDLALAIACDTVEAALACPGVEAVFAVTEDPRAGAELTGLGVVVVGGEPGTGLNSALAHGAAAARRRRPGAGVCALSADLPALRPDELGRVLAAAARHGRSFLPDAPGVGTTLLAAAPGHPFTPAFEGASRARHRDGGAHEIALPDVASVRRDVDTPEDLCDAVGLGVGPRTRELWETVAGSCLRSQGAP
ncbi:2-phospho-L-lactate guanylyltransferase [Nocardiopsis tropica]